MKKITFILSINLKKHFVFLALSSILLLLSACAVGPNYKRPAAIVPLIYKEAPPPKPGWKLAQPLDEYERGEWWKIFENPEIDLLMTQIDISNQNIAAALAQYLQARAQVEAAQSSFFPVAAVAATVSRQKTPAGLASSSSANTNIISATFNTFSLIGTATWEPDIWGSVRRMVESKKASAQASLAQLAATRLSAQAMLAQLYFQLRTLDRDQVLLNHNVRNYQKILELTHSQFKAGTASLANIAQAQAQLKAAQVLAIDNGVNRAQYEHAMAVLIGQPPAHLALLPKMMILKPPRIPPEIPSALLERRPDIAQAERQMAATNASIGVAIAAYFPVLGLTATGGYQSNQLRRLFTKPQLLWSIGAQLAETVFDGGLRNANVKIARATYFQAVATYRQTVLAAFQNVEDNLSTLRILENEAITQNQAVAAARLALRLVMDDYKMGTAALIDLLNAQVTLYTAEKNASDIAGRRMVAAVGLITALGGGWDARVVMEDRYPIKLRNVI